MISYSDIIGNIEAIAYSYISNKAHRKYRLTENLKNKAIACCGRGSAIALSRHLILNFAKLPIVLLAPITSPTNTAKTDLTVRHQYQLTYQSLL